MRAVRFTSELWVAAPRAEVFRFFSDATNLQAITPPWLHFQVLTPSPIDIREGAAIDYRLRVHGLPIRWRSEITRWDPPIAFVDEQRRGPYKRWVHTHTFTEDRGGTLVGDAVDYDVPLAFIAGWFVAADVRRIFAYRRQALASIFRSSAGS